MKVEDTILLGFIGRAKDYLKLELARKGNDAELRSLEGIDVEALKKALVEKSKGALKADSSNEESLLKVGSDAFDELINNKNDKDSLLSEFTQLFDSFGKKERNVKDDLNEILSYYEPVPSEDFINEDDEYLKIISEASAKASLETAENTPAPAKEARAEGLDDVFNEILGAENEKKAEPKKEEHVIPTSEEYLKELINELKNKIEIENGKKIITNKVSIFEKISNLYPYLSGGFIRAVYGLKDGIAKENPAGARIILLHRIYFKDVEGLRQFVEIVSNHDYNVNVDEEKLLVDVFKEHYNTDGKILTNIFEIANQAKVLDGDYEGYRIVKREEK